MSNILILDTLNGPIMNSISEIFACKQLIKDVVKNQSNDYCSDSLSSDKFRLFENLTRRDVHRRW